MKTSNQRKKEPMYEVSDSDASLLVECLKEKYDEIAKEAFYYPKHHQEFYNIYKSRIGRMIDMFSGMPRPVLKEWKFDIPSSRNKRKTSSPKKKKS